MVHGRNYPVSEIQGKFCENQECTIPLPILHGANYLNYINNPLYRRIYSVLWGGTYFGGRDFGLGAHKGIDITSRKWTPIYAMGSGVVIFAGEKGARGKVVSIEHSFAGKKIVSNYAHLEEILVKVWVQVEANQLIAKMGSSGNSTGPHLHFQIDTNIGKHPYHPWDCGGETLNQNVNEARCRNLVKKNTIDPILFLETQGEILAAEWDELPSMKSAFLELKNLNLPLRNPLHKVGKSYYYEISSTMSGFLKEPLVFVGSGVKFFPEQISVIGEKRRVFVQSEDGNIPSFQIWMGDRLVREVKE